MRIAHMKISSLLRLRGIAFFAAFGYLLFCTAHPVAAQYSESDPTINSETQWQSNIEVAITSPSQGDNSTYIFINQSIALTASATETAQYSNDGGVTWNQYAPGGSTDTGECDLSWSTSDGSGSFSEYLLPNTTWYAPDYAAGQDVRTFTIIVTATTPAGGQVAAALGAPLPLPAQANLLANVNQITLTASQAGAAQGPYTNPLPPGAGNGKLGWIVPGNPPAAVIYGGATEITGKLNAGPWNVPAVVWNQTKWGSVTIATTNANNPKAKNGVITILDAKQGQPDPDITNSKSAAGAHKGAGYPFIAQNKAPDTWYLYDFPNAFVGAQNDGGIAAGDTAIHDDSNFDTWVEDGNNTKISNDCSWVVKFDISAVNGVWVPAQAHTP